MPQDPTNQDAFLKDIRGLIARDELAQALQQLQQFLAHTPQLDEVIQQSGRFANIRKQIRLGTVSHAEANLTRNQIRAALLELLNEIGKQQAEVPALGAEAARAISILQSKNVVAGSNISGQSVHIGDVVYQNSPAAAAGPSRIYSRRLVPALLDAMARLGNGAAQQVQQAGGWLDSPERFRKVQNFVCRSFVGEIGKQLRRLINIGDDQQMEPKAREQHYLNKCLDIAKRALDLVNYTLLAAWREAAKQGSITLQPEQRKVVAAFFSNRFGLDLPESFQLLQALCRVFEANGLAWPFAELPALKAEWQDSASPLSRACVQLEADVKAQDCERAEQNLAEILARLVFLTRYRMASVKKVGYRLIRRGQPEYLHRYVAIGIDVKFSEDTEKGKWAVNGEQNPAVLLYLGEDYSQGVNLFPFVIDYNALTFEQGAKICFFSAQDLSEDSLLEYRFLGDNSTVSVRRQGVFHPGAKRDELMLQPETLKAFNLDCVVDSFVETRQALLGTEADIFDTL